ncbi:hypothetical protein ACLHZ0_21450 [Aeromonas salmonicida]|uniref:hypothetical protein n=1 Tax=Aeromonas salmonicida TaxID=645 RepID=UPI003D00DF93
MIADNLKKWWSNVDITFLLIFIVAVAVVACYAIFLYARVVVPIIEAKQIPPQTISAGQILDIKLHDSMLSVNSTVTTTVGIYQVIGAVSANIGDASQLKTETLLNNEKKSFLCIISEVKTGCYRIL